ncbi:MAG: phage tail sheath C-terminal domain-containing protein [Pseudomonadota bacterium]
MEQVLPGVSIEVRSEGLIIPGQIQLSTVGVVGTASRGPVNDPQIIGSATEAEAVFGDPGAYDRANAGGELTLVRALQIAFDSGARDALAVRVESGALAQRAAFDLQASGGLCCTLEASTPGEWANDLTINVTTTSENAFINDEALAAGDPLTFTPVVDSARTRIFVRPTGSSDVTAFAAIFNGAPLVGQVLVDTATGALTFNAAQTPVAGDTVLADYVVASTSARQVTLKRGDEEEVYVTVNGEHFAGLLAGSALARRRTSGPNIDLLPDAFAAATEFQRFAGGTNAAVNANYTTGLDALSTRNAFIIVAAGQDHRQIGAALTAHVTTASSDLNKRERIGVVGSGVGTNATNPEDVDRVLGHSLASDRVVFVAPGIRVFDRGSGNDVTLPGSYAAAMVAGMISGFPVNRSLTNKPVAVTALEEDYTTAELRQLVLARVLAIEKRLGFRTVKGITTSTNSAFAQVTTRRIVDKMKYGVRSAANPYIGLLNNTRVRAALQATIDSFLNNMVLAEELAAYELSVTASRQDEIAGIARVAITAQPVFSIDFIKVVITLQ